MASTILTLICSLPHATVICLWMAAFYGHNNIVCVQYNNRISRLQSKHLRGLKSSVSILCYYLELSLILPNTVSTCTCSKSSTLLLPNVGLRYYVDTENIVVLGPLVNKTYESVLILT
jgi:hypothetical protein